MYFLRFTTNIVYYVIVYKLNIIVNSRNVLRMLYIKVFKARLIQIHVYLCVIGVCPNVLSMFTKL